MDSVGSSETQSAGAITQRPNRAERLAGIAPRAFALVVRAADRLEGGGGAKPGQRQLGDAPLCFAPELMRKGVVHTPRPLPGAQRLIEGGNPPDVAPHA